MKILIKKGTIHNGIGQVFKETDLFVEDGKIIEIGTNLNYQSDCVIDATNQEVLPGFIDPITGWGCAAGRGQSNDNDETSDAMTPHLNVYYAFDPSNINYQELYGYGITSVGVAPSNNNILGGQMAVFKTQGQHLNQMLVKESVAMKGSVNASVKETYGSRNVAPMTRMGIYHQLQEMLKKADEFKEEDAKDCKVQAMHEVTEGKMPLVMSCNTTADIDALLHTIENKKIEIIIANSYGLSKNLLNTDCSIVLGDLVDAFSKYNHDIDYDALFALIEKGQCVALSAFGDGTSPGREILLWNAHEVARQAARHQVELCPETLLRMISFNAAKMLHVENRIGSLEVGKDADIVIWSHHPLMTTQAHPTTVLISGEVVMKGEAA